jgi:hypothetical protein
MGGLLMPQGVTPVDVSSNTGKVRFLIGDTKYVATTQTGVGEYNYFSDRDIEDFLTLGSGSPHRAAGYIFNQWASVAATEAETVQDTDLKIDLEKRYKALVERANWFFGEADKLDDAAGGEDAFQIVPTGRRHHHPAELTARWGWDNGW